MSFQYEIQRLILHSGLHQDAVNDHDHVRSKSWRRGFKKGFLDVLAAPGTLFCPDRTRPRRIRDIILREINACDGNSARDAASDEKSGSKADARPPAL